MEGGRRTGDAVGCFAGGDESPNPDKETKEEEEEEEEMEEEKEEKDEDEEGGDYQELMRE